MISLAESFTATFTTLIQARSSSRTRKCDYCGTRYYPLSSYSFCCEQCKEPSRSGQVGRLQHRRALAATW